jgi:protein TonB
MNRKLTIAINVVLFHIAALWALQNGLLQRAVDLIVPAEILSEFISPPVPAVTAPPPAPPAPVKPTITKTPAPSPTPVPVPAMQAEQAPAPISVAVTPKPAAPVAPAAPPAPARVELPTSAADYLQNPKPPYPPISKRLGEQGKVVVRVLIGVDGTAQRAEISQSSGFDRLDQAALATVLRWRYVPGKRGGVAEAMWFNVPINFVLE